jgi:hypothetical protein
VGRVDRSFVLRNLRVRRETRVTLREWLVSATVRILWSNSFNAEQPAFDQVRVANELRKRIIALYDSSGSGGGICAAAHIRSGYVKLLGVSFVGVIFCAGAMARLFAWLWSSAWIVWQCNVP